jgi:signal transduction histidine kinase
MRPHTPGGNVKNAWAILLLWVLLPVLAAHAAVNVENGVLDLRGQDLEQPIRAQGDWDFYWNQLLTPGDLEQSQASKASITVPGLWSQDPAQYPAMGYATYHLKVLVDPERTLALFLDASIWSASRIFIDGKEVATQGKVGTTAETSEGGIATRIFEIHPQNTSFDLIIQVSNFEIFLCGITIAPQFGTLETLSRARNQKIAIDVFIVGGLVIMGIYHLCLFLLRTEEPSTLWFAAMVCGSALWQATIRNGLASIFIPDLGFDTRLRVYNNAWILAIAACSWYFHFVFRASYSRKVPWFATVAAIVFLASTLITGPRFFVGFANVYHFVTLFILVYTVFIVIRAAHRREEEGRLMLFGLSILAVTAIHDILAIREIINSPMMTAGGLFGFIFFQSFFLARRFSKAFVTVKQSESEIRSLSEDLKALNSRLEQLVDEKIRDIRSIMEHIPLGILMIQQNRKVHKDHSKKVYEFFDKSGLETADAIDLIFAGSNLSSDQKSQAISCIHASLDEDVMNFTMNQHVLPLEMMQKTGEERPRALELTWDPIVTDKNRIDKILVTMRDVTDLRHLQERSQEQQQELEYISEIMNIPPERFQQFMQTCDELMEQTRNLLANAVTQETSNKLLKILFINMHTLKGTARGLYLKQLSQVFHEFEHSLAQIRDGAAWDTGLLQKHLSRVQKQIDYYRNMAQRRLGRSSEKAQTVEFSLTKLEDLYQSLRAEPALVKFRDLFFGKIFKDARLVFEDLFSSVPILARDLGKENPHISLETNGLYLTRRAEVIFRKVFIHLIRNALDHGLESAEERKRAGKDPVGTITIRMSRVGDQMELHCYDDGRGLNLRRLKDRAIQSKVLPAEAQASPQALAVLIFHAGMSTAQELSDVSGRGIGMNAVLAFLEQNGGSIAIELDSTNRTALDHVRFRLMIRLPFELFEETSFGLRSAG